MRATEQKTINGIASGGKTVDVDSLDLTWTSNNVRSTPNKILWDMSHPIPFFYFISIRLPPYIRPRPSYFNLIYSQKHLLGYNI